MLNDDRNEDEALAHLAWATYASICRIGQKKAKQMQTHYHTTAKMYAHHEAILQAFYFFEQLINSIVEENRDGIRAEAIEAQAEQKSKEQDQVSAPVVENGDEQAAPDQP